MRSNIKKRYGDNFREDFFEDINSEEQAYWLGFLMADGNVYIHKDANKSPVISFLLNKKDIDQLHKFHTSLKSKQTIYKKHNGYIRSSHSSRKMAADLIKLGCTPRKSLTLEFPNLSSILHNHFVRGYFDGDGCVYISNKNTNSLRINILGTFEFLTVLENVLLNQGIDCRVYKAASYQKVYTLSMGNISTRCFAIWIYQHANIYLDRKKKICDTHYVLLKSEIYQCDICKYWFQRRYGLITYCSEDHLIDSCCHSNDRLVGLGIITGLLPTLSNVEDEILENENIKYKRMLGF